MKKFNYLKLTLIVLLTLICGLGFQLIDQRDFATADNLRLDDQEATIRAIKQVQPAVVSVIVYGDEKQVSIDLGTGQQKVEKKRIELGSGTGFLISADGLILTNKHVVNAASEGAEYKVIMNNGKKYNAGVLSKDPLNDLAILKIDDHKLPFVALGDSDKLQIGTTVVAIGNALGRYQNSATKGIISGLGRSIMASDKTGYAESLDNVLQTDAEINPGNSGGPLVDLNGKVVGVNVAVDQTGQSVGFAIPINDVKSAIQSVQKTGKIIRPRLGIRYVMVTPEISAQKNLNKDYGALIISEGAVGSSILTGSPAEKAGLQEGDIIFEIDAVKVEGRNSLLSIVQKYKPGAKIGMKIQRGSVVLLKTLTLDAFPEE